MYFVTWENVFFKKQILKGWQGGISSVYISVCRHMKNARKL